MVFKLGLNLYIIEVIFVSLYYMFNIYVFMFDLIYIVLLLSILELLVLDIEVVVGCL